MSEIFSIPTVIAGGAELPDDVSLDFFGEDFLFTDDLQVTASGDYALIAGYEALRQAIRIRLMVSPGEYTLQPDFGIGVADFVKRRATQADFDQLRQRIIDQLGQEDRIDKVEEVLVARYDSGDRTGVKISIRVRALGRENSFNAVFSE